VIWKALSIQKGPESKGLNIVDQTMKRDCWEIKEISEYKSCKEKKQVVMMKETHRSRRTAAGLSLYPYGIERDVHTLTLLHLHME